MKPVWLSETTNVKPESRSVVLAGDMVLYVGDTVFSTGNSNPLFYRVDVITVDSHVELVCYAMGYNNPGERGRYMVYNQDIERVLTRDYHMSAHFNRSKP